MKGYRTFVFNLIMPVLMILVTVGIIGPEEAPDAESVNMFLDNLEATLAGIWAIVNIILRALTTGPIGTKE